MEDIILGLVVLAVLWELGPWAWFLFGCLCVYRAWELIRGVFFPPKHRDLL